MSMINTLMLWLGLAFTVTCLHYTLRIQAFIGRGPISWLALAFGYSTVLRVALVFNDMYTMGLDLMGPYFLFHIFSAIGLYQLSRAIKLMK